MRIQDAVLDALEKNRGEYLSGEQLASSLGVSRNAVWKAIQKLEEAGHKIRAVPKRGYTLAPESDVLTVQSVSRFLDTDMPVYLQVQTEVTSTNTLLKAQAEQGAPDDLVRREGGLFRRMVELQAHPLPIPDKVDSWLVAEVC